MKSLSLRCKHWLRLRFLNHFDIRLRWLEYNILSMTRCNYVIVPLIFILNVITSRSRRIIFSNWLISYNLCIKWNIPLLNFVLFMRKVAARTNLIILNHYYILRSTRRFIKHIFFCLKYKSHYIINKFIKILNILLWEMESQFWVMLIIS